jgi:hypothetical protein
MLSDLESQKNKAILDASIMEDGILSRAKRMTLVPTDEREALLIECESELSKLEEINQ